jgi:hypothetical protein
MGMKRDSQYEKRRKTTKSMVVKVEKMKRSGVGGVLNIFCEAR